MAYTVPPPSLIPSALTTVGGVGTWVNGADPQGINVTQNIGFVASVVPLINAASRYMFNIMSRNSFLAHPVNEVRKGVGTDNLMLREWPVLALSSFSIGPLAIAAQTVDGATGYVLEAWDGYGAGNAQRLWSIGRCLSDGPAGNVINYVAGYAILDEPAAAAAAVWVQAPQGRFARDYRVKTAAGVLMTPVTGTPSAGQYNAPTSPTDPDQVPYIFSAADIAANLQVLISYSYIPADIDYACAKWVGEAVMYRSRIGMQSKSLGGQETVTFKIKEAPDDVVAIMQQFSRNISV